MEGVHEIEFNHPHLKINYPWDIFALNREAIEHDFKMITHGRKSKVLSDSNRLIAEENIFVEAGAKVECAIITLCFSISSKRRHRLLLSYCFIILHPQSIYHHRFHPSSASQSWKDFLVLQ